MDSAHAVTMATTPHFRRDGGAPIQVTLAHPSGNQFFRHLAVALRDSGMLGQIFTCIDWKGRLGSDRFLPAALRSELCRRGFSRELRVEVSSHPWREASRLAASRLGLRRLTTHESGIFSVDAVYRDFDRWVARRLSSDAKMKVVYAYEDAAEATFVRGKQEGWRCVYDLPIAYWETSRRLLEQEAARWPEWEPTLVGNRDSTAKLDRKSRELRMADLVVCPSRFVADSLPADLNVNTRVVVAPFGSPVSVPERELRRSGPLRVLFAGSMTQRKGLADLFAAVRLANSWELELIVMGSPVVDLNFYRRHARFTYEPPRPHDEVLRLMARCDVLCLPSIVEGRALVVQEAMRVGLPVLVTENTGTSDVVTAGGGGIVVPIRSPQALAEKLMWFVEHRHDLADMGAAARRAAAGVTWEEYGQRVIAGLSEMCRTDVLPLPTPTACPVRSREDLPNSIV
jgi:glycosyltransferase involved in cell wall biosynthesis